ncbi:HAD hydrolase-like protein [Petroclostridium sp. X23]|uniref:HAD family hydrolase n=1 Tax=Petroclostridium sp. X23 TaxID=3045146 RepID=UPI0024AE1F21|nr:HAD hydrolase-like protein [Petroclostridium sp. X23]WHH57825.1 HAD hydrolase-like protein [Petroclostridium sp. X23]
MIKTKDIREIGSLLESKKVFIFDFDGTIADTETLHWAAYDICLSEFNIALTKKHIDRYIGNAEIKIYSMLKDDFGISFDDDTFFDKRISIYLELIKKKDLKPFNFFMDLFNKYRDICFCILSSQKLNIINDLLKLWDLDSAFDKIISVASGDMSKADILSDTYHYYGAYNNEVVLFEDTNRNLALAQQERILAIGIEHQYNKSVLVDCNAIIGDRI